MKLLNRHQEAVRIRRDGVRPPLRSAKEMAEEFEVSWRQLASALATDKRDGLDTPQPVVRHLSGVHCNSWYRPAEMRAWWAARQKPAAALEPGPDPIVLSYSTDVGQQLQREEHPT